MKSIVILISGHGSNLRSILDASLPLRIKAVVSNNPTAGGLEIAKAHGVATAVVDHRGFASRADFDAALGAEIDRHQPDLLVLAGFMRILTDAFVERYAGRMINIHPSLLPSFPGLDTHAAALREGVKIHGCTVHFVTPRLDHGPIIVQAAVAVLPNDSAESLAQRVLEQEHRVFPQALRWFAEGRLHVGASGTVTLDGPTWQQPALLSPWDKP
jgi:phosphoribosylglycinamide formyltransferase-1